jgi:hypothetical protein
MSNINIEYKKKGVSAKQNCMEQREVEPPTRMSLRPRLLWLTVNPALIIQSLSTNSVT